MMPGYHPNSGLPEQPYSDHRMKPLETGYSDDADEENEFHHDSQYIEDEVGGKSGVMRNGRSDTRKSFCHPNNKYIILAALVFVILALGAGLSVNKNEKEESESHSSPQTPAPVPVSSPTPTPPPTQAPTTSSPVPVGPQPTWTPTLSPVEAGPTPFTRSFQNASDLIYPPERDPSLPAFVNPSTAFGHLVALNFEGDQFVVAMKSSPDDPPDYYGGFHLYRWDLIGNKYIWEQTVYDNLAAPPTTAQHHQSMSFRQDRLAFTQGTEVAVYFQTGADDLYQFLPLGANIKDFGTINSDVSILSLDWYASQVALSPTGMLLAVLLSNNNNQPGMIEIYRDKETHNHEGVMDTWEFKARIPLSTKVSGGTLAFSEDELTLAVGVFDESDPQSITENLATFSSDFNSITWNSVGNPKAVANNVLTGDGSLGGSVMSLSNDGQFLAVGSKGGILNQVVMLKWNSAIGEWEPYGGNDNNLLEGKATDSRFGASIETNSAGNLVYVGAPGSGNMTGEISVYEYDAACDCWNEYAEPLETDKQGDLLGTAFALDHDVGIRMIAGYPGLVKDGGTVPVGAIKIFQVNDLAYIQ